MNKGLITLGLLLVFAFAQQAGADPARLINYQGRLTDSNGVPLANGSYDMTFKIYDALTLGTLLWTETHTGAAQVTVTNGLFSVVLGSGTALPDFNSTPYYIEITVGATVYSPRKQLTGSAFSVNADLLDGQHASYYQRRVSGTCGAGSSIRIINADGTVTCQTDVGVTAHGSLTGLGNDDHPQYFALAQDEAVTGRPAFNGGTTGSNSPFDVDSTYVVANLNADLIDGYHASSFILDGCADCLNATEIEDIYVLNSGDTMTGALTMSGAGIAMGNQDVTNAGTIEANVLQDNDDATISINDSVAITGGASVTGQITSTLAAGTAPFAVTSTTLNTNLNADLLDGYHAADLEAVLDHGQLTGLGDDDHPQYFALAQNETVTGIPAFNGGTSGSSAPFSVDSTYTVTNLNTDLLDGYNSPQLGNFGNWQTHGTYIDCNTDPSYWGWNFVQGTTNCPNATSSQWYRGNFSLGSDYPMRGASGYSLELAIPRFSPGSAGIWVRTVEGGAIGGWTRIDGSDLNSGAWTLSGSNLYPDSTAYNVAIGGSSPSVKLHVTGNAFIDTSGNTAAERSATIKTNGQAQINFGAYPGAWTSALQIQNNNNTRNVWISPLDAASGANARFRTGATGLDFYTGGTTTDTGTLAMTLDTSGNVSTNGEVLAGALRTPASGYSSGAPFDSGDVAVDYPGSSGWAGTWNSNILLSGLNSTSISFHDSGASVATFRYTGNNFYLGENVGWGVSNLTVGGNINTNSEFQAEKVCRFTTAFTVNGTVASCPSGYCVEAIVNDATKNVMAMGDYNQRGVTQFGTGRLMCCRCSISYP